MNNVTEMKNAFHAVMSRLDVTKERITELESLSAETQKTSGSSHHGALEMNPTRNPEVAGLIPNFAQWVKDLALL